MAHVEDRWTVAGEKGRRVRNTRWGTGKRWLAVWNDRDGRRKRSFDTKDAATAFLATIDVAQRAGIRTTTRVTLEEFGDEWIRSQVQQRKSTQGQARTLWQRHIRPELGALLVADIVRSDVQRAVVKWSTTLAPKSVSNVQICLAGIMKGAIADRIITINPCTGVRLPRHEVVKVVPLTVAEVHAIAERIHPHYKAMILLGAATGMRSGELRGLTVDRLLFDGERLRINVDRQLLSHVPTWGPPKTPRSVRVINVGADTAEMLRRHMARWPPKVNGLIFNGLKGSPLSRNAVATAWAKATAGIDTRPRSGLHDLRHFHASMLIAAGLSVTAVADRLGHRDVAQTLSTYAHLWPDDESRAIRAVESTLWHTPGVGQPPQSPQLSVVAGHTGS